MKNNSKPIQTPETILSKLTELEQVSSELKSVLTKRDIPEIWQKLSVQEKLASWLFDNVNSDTKNQTNAPGIATSVKADLRQNIQNVVGRIRRIQSANMAMASAFVQVVDRAIMSLDENRTSKTGTYSREGGMRRNNTPVLLQQEG